MPLRQDGAIAGEGSLKRAKRAALSLLVVALAVLASAAVASASVSFERTWGWGVSSGSSAFQVCTSSCQAGISGSGAGQFSFLAGVATDPSGNVYVADQSNHRIEKFDSSGNFISMWSGDGQLNFPEGVATDPSGNVYVADTNNNRVEKLDSSGNFLRTWGWGVSDGSNAFQICTSSCQAGADGSGDGQLSDPDGIAADSSGNVYVSDTDNARIEKFDSSGNFLRTWGWGVSDGSNAFQVCTSSCQAGISGGGAGQLNLPQGVATDSSGNVYVADTSGRIKKYDSSGNFITEWGSFGSGDGDLSNPEGIATDSSGDVYVADTGNNRVEKFDSSGDFITKWGTAGSGDGQFNTPWGIATDSSGNVYVADQFNNRIQQFLVAPDAPTVSSSPASPANDNSPKIIGSAQPGSTVKLYTSSDCSGSPLATGSAAAYASPGLPVSVADDSQTTFYATATDVTPSACSAGFTYTEDSTAPAGAHILTALPAFTLKSPFRVAWGGATDSQSGIAHYKAYKLSAPYNGPFGNPMLFATTSSGSSAFPAATPARTYCFYVTATDNAGNVSNPSAQKCTALPVDDAALTGPGWTRKTAQAGYYRGTYSQSQTRGATLTRTGVQARRLALVATKLPNGGTVEVAQGGTVLKHVSLAAQTTQRERVIPIASFASVHTGAVTIKVTSSGKPVRIDGLGVSRAAIPPA